VLPVLLSFTCHVLSRFWFWAGPPFVRIFPPSLFGASPRSVRSPSLFPQCDSSLLFIRAMGSGIRYFHFSMQPCGRGDSAPRTEEGVSRDDSSRAEPLICGCQCDTSRSFWMIKPRFFFFPLTERVDPPPFAKALSCASPNFWDYVPPLLFSFSLFFLRAVEELIFEYAPAQFFLFSTLSFVGLSF